MRVFSFDASEVRWQDNARCSGALDFDFTPSVERNADLESVRSAFCNLCPVRVECLAYALLYRMSGYWGGTSTLERTRLAYNRERVKCPVCAGKAVVHTEEEHQICQSCGASWRAAVTPKEIPA